MIIVKYILRMMIKKKNSCIDLDMPFLLVVLYIDSFTAEFLFFTQSILKWVFFRIKFPTTNCTHEM